jgi:hypothetical protein
MWSAFRDPGIYLALAAALAVVASAFYQFNEKAKATELNDSTRSALTKANDRIETLTLTLDQERRTTNKAREEAIQASKEASYANRQLLQHTTGSRTRPVLSAFTNEPHYNTLYVVIDNPSDFPIYDVKVEVSAGPHVSKLGGDDHRFFNDKMIETYHPGTLVPNRKTQVAKLKIENPIEGLSYSYTVIWRFGYYKGRIQSVRKVDAQGTQWFAIDYAPYPSTTAP